MDYFGQEDIGPDKAAAGPTPDAVAVVAQRLESIAREIDAVRLALGPLRALGWQSMAAAAFGESVTVCNTAMVEAVKDVRAGAQAVQFYAQNLESAAAGSSYTGPGLGPWFNGGPQ